MRPEETDKSRNAERQPDDPYQPYEIGRTALNEWGFGLFCCIGLIGVNQLIVPKPSQGGYKFTNTMGDASHDPSPGQAQGQSLLYTMKSLARLTFIEVHREPHLLMVVDIYGCYFLKHSTTKQVVNLE